MKKLSILFLCASIAACSPIPAAALSISSDSIPELKEMQMEMIRNGYYKEYTEYAQVLIHLKDRIKYHKPSNPKFNDNDDLYIYKKFTDVRLAYKAKLPRGINPSSIIGASPLGMYLKDRHGWTGFKLYFKHNPETICSLASINLTLAEGDIVLNKDEQNFSVNKKPGFKLTSGSKQSGFIYSVNWYDKKYIYMLDCATLKFKRRGLENAEIIANVIEGQDKRKS